MIKNIFKLLIVITVLLPISKVHATVYYIDFVNGKDTNTGLGTTSLQAYQSLDKFAESARSNGDIAFVRRGMASTTNVSAINVLTAGTVTNPIIMEADYDNLWNDFATTSQTYTLAVGSTTLTASANQSDIIVGNWIYVMGDCVESATTTAGFGYNTCEFAYEVSAVSSTSVSLYLPYKGGNAGSGKEIRRMPSAPQWNVASGNFNISFASARYYWILKGLDLRGTSVAGQIGVTFSGVNTLMYDLILTGNGASDAGFTCNVDNKMGAEKIRTVNQSSGSFLFNTSCYPIKGSYIKNSYLSNLISANGGSSDLDLYISETYLQGGISLTTNGNAVQNVYTRNVRNTTFTNFTSFVAPVAVYNEDYNGIVSGNNIISSFGNSNTVPIASSTFDATFIRSGGGRTSEQVIPSSNTNNKWEFSMQKLFEYPIYADTTSKTYSMYFMSTSTSAWTANPISTATTSEMWIECEYWNFPTTGTSTRAIKKSTGTMNFTGSTAWQALSVTCQPTTSGMLYLRGWYGKTLEGSGKMNEFYMDTTPVIN